MRPRLLPLVALAAGLALPSAASASVAIGTNFASDAGGNSPNGCESVCTATNIQLPAANTAAGGLTAPSDGVVVRWRVKSGSSGNPISLRVLHPAGGTFNFTGAGTSAPSQTVSGLTDPIPTRLPIRAGDSIGLNPQNSALVWAPTNGGTLAFWSTTNGFTNGLNDGATGTGTGSSGNGSSTAGEVLVQAVIEPDADKDGFGNETQDGCPGDAARQTPPCGSGNTNPNGNPPPPAVNSPKISSARVSPASFRLGTTARIKFTLSKLAKYTLAFDQIKAGRKRGKRCVPQSRTVRTGARCTAFVRRATRSGAGRLGANSLAFTGRVAGKALPLGAYRITFVAVDSAGNAAAAKTARFTLRPRLARRR
jgi:hypothetical protein